MSPRRTGLIFRIDFFHAFRRPLFWVLLVVLALTAWGMSQGNVSIQSGDSRVGGTKAWLTSEFAVAQILSMLIFIFYMFFIAIAAGMSIIHDDDKQVGEILHATPLRAGEYVWGKFLAVMSVFVLILGIHVLFAMLFNHVFPNPAADEIRGPFAAVNYVRPAAVFGLPPILFLAGMSFAVGAWTRRPILVFAFPIFLILVCAFFLWEWSPDWLDPRVNRLLMLLDPSGFRWLNETWLTVDRGVEFYNREPMTFDAPFLLSRLAYAAAGFGFVALTGRMLARRLRGDVKGRGKKVKGARLAAQAPEPDTAASALPAPAAGRLGRSAGAGGFLGDAWTVARFEARELWGSPGLYLFIPIILIQVIGEAMFALGPFDTPVLLTSGLMAMSTMNTITLLVCLLLLFYTVESLQRERNTGLWPIYYTTPIRTTSVLFGKALANALVAATILLAGLLASWVVLLIQGTAGFSIRPFALVWGALLIPTFLVWSAFVIALQAITGSRYATYAFGLGALILTGYKQMTGKMTWVFNWDVWGVERWSDMGTFELNRGPLILNRLLALALMVFLIALTVRVFDRRGRDAIRTVHALRARSLLRQAAVLAPFAVPVLVLGIVLTVQVNRGHQGKAAEKAAKDYWRANIATWKGAPLPALAHVDVDLELEPADRSLMSRGVYHITNHLPDALDAIPLTFGTRWDSLSWTLDGEPYEPEKRSGLYVVRPETALQPGDSLRVGWYAAGRQPDGATKNGGGAREFILPQGVVLTSFEASFVPFLGFTEEIGIDKDNRYDPREYPDDHYEGVTPSGFGSDIPFTTRIRITGPAEYAYNSVGTMVDDRVTGDRRTVVWESDHPVAFFNVVAGRWAVSEGEGTRIFYHPGHAYNIEEMQAALDASRKHYSEWFYEYPWRELKLSEFANLAGYAQGFPTNITFSEGIGFLTKSDENSDLAFMVTAHEAAHQWWGSILTPGVGPGGNILSEGMAHFSTLLLTEEVLGTAERIAFTKKIESRYGERRRKDSERPLVKIDGEKPGDTTVTYDKGGFVFWMLLNAMGRETALAGIHDFIHRYSPGPDHALLEDFVAVMREHASDPGAFDLFADQWFFDVVVPEYRIRGETRARVSGADDLWDVAFTVENRGTGSMPVEIAVSRGERFPDDDEDAGSGDGEGEIRAASMGSSAPAASAETATAGGEEYRDVRTTVHLDAGESREVRLRTSFEPRRILVDPDALVLQLNRNIAVARF